jgi:hypothetical protein
MRVPLSEHLSADVTCDCIYSIHFVGIILPMCTLGHLYANF